MMNQTTETEKLHGIVFIGATSIELHVRIFFHVKTKQNFKREIVRSYSFLFRKCLSEWIQFGCEVIQSIESSRFDYDTISLPSLDQ